MVIGALGTGSSSSIPYQSRETNANTNDSERVIRVVNIPDRYNKKAIYGIGKFISEALIGQQLVRTAPILSGNRYYDWSYSPGISTIPATDTEYIRLCSARLRVITETHFIFVGNLGSLQSTLLKEDYDDDNWMELNDYIKFVTSPSLIYYCADEAQPSQPSFSTMYDMDYRISICSNELPISETCTCICINQCLTLTNLIVAGHILRELDETDSCYFELNDDEDNGDLEELQDCIRHCDFSPRTLSLSVNNQVVEIRQNVSPYIEKRQIRGSCVQSFLTSLFFLSITEEFISTLMGSCLSDMLMQANHPSTFPLASEFNSIPRIPRSAYAQDLYSSPLIPRYSPSTSLPQQITLKDKSPHVEISSNVLVIESPMTLVETEPELLLNMIGDKLRLNKELPKQLQMQIMGKNRPVDAGAPRRVFISTLFHSIKIGKSDKLKFCQVKEGFYLPRVSHYYKLRKDEEKAFKNLGMMIAFLFNSTEHYPIGQFFDPRFFNFLLDPSLHVPIGKLSQREIFEIYGRKLGSENKIIEIETLMKAKYIVMPSTSSSEDLDISISPEIIETYQAYGYEMSQESFEQDKKSILKEFNQEILNIRKAIQLIARGVSKVYPMQRLQEKGTQALTEKLHGYLSEELFKNAVTFDLPLNENDEALLDRSLMMNVWFNEWVKDINLEKMRNFLKRTTGSTEYTRMVIFKVTRAVDAPIEHACFGKVDMPMHYTEQECIDYFDDLSSGVYGNGFNCL